jgi:BMFP domain-containing protein YqiC
MRSARDNLNFLNDIAKMATGAMGSLTEVKQHVKTLVKERVDQALEDMDVVSRREFDKVEAMAKRARERQEDLEKRLTDLEKKLKKTAAKPAAVKRKKK